MPPRSAPPRLLKIPIKKPKNRTVGDSRDLEIAHKLTDRSNTGSREEWELLFSGILEIVARDRIMAERSNRGPANDKCRRAALQARAPRGVSPLEFYRKTYLSLMAKDLETKTAYSRRTQRTEA